MGGPRARLALTEPAANAGVTLVDIQMTHFPNLLAPYDFGFLKLRNRMVMGAMHTRLETLDRPQERLTEFFRARARGEAALILTGGFAPNLEGRMEEDAPVLDHETDLTLHRSMTGAVHAEGGRVVLQILHAGRYAKHPLCVGPTDVRAPINSHVPRALGTAEVWSTIQAIAQTAALARKAGYDGVEIMGSEGYLLNEFTSALTNTRDDEFGGSFENRIRLPVETVKAVRAAAGEGFLIVFRISTIDLVEGGMTGAETATYARALEAAGVHLFNTGIGWHEAAVPTIASSVPRAAWRFAIENVKRAVSVPVIASNRFNVPETGEQLLADGAADFVSMARPFLADPAFARKVRENRPDSINTCIGCNQACLDNIFTERSASCMVNPRAGHEIEFPEGLAATRRRVAVVGGGPAGMSFAVSAAERGHEVELFEAEQTLGGQINYARMVPGKNEFNEMLRYFRTRIGELGVRLHLGRRVGATELTEGGYDAIVIATGVVPRTPDIEGIDHPMVASYIDVLSGRRPMGQRVAVIGAGGIGFDVAQYLVGDAHAAEDTAGFLRDWGVDATLQSHGGLTAPTAPRKGRQVAILQRREGRPGGTLGKSTGWILKARLRRAGVRNLVGVTYQRIDDRGLHCLVQGKPQLLEVDNVVICAGQDSLRTLADALAATGHANVHTIGGASLASELDAVRAIDEATRLACSL